LRAVFAMILLKKQEEVSQNRININERLLFWRGFLWIEPIQVYMSV
jgi:hypothetical protein